MMNANKNQLAIFYSSSLILLHFEFKEASSELRNGWIVIRTRWWPPPFADADGFSPSVSVHQLMRCVGIGWDRRKLALVAKVVEVELPVKYYMIRFRIKVDSMGGKFVLFFHLSFLWMPFPGRK